MNFKIPEPLRSGEDFANLNASLTAWMKNQPATGRRAIATLGPDDQPNERVEVTILEAKGPMDLDTWLCEDDNGRRLAVRTRKLKLL